MSLNLIDVKAYQDYVEDFNPQIMSQMFLEFDTPAFATLHEGLKGKEVLTEMFVGDLVQAGKTTFDPKTDSLKFTPRVLETRSCKVDIELYPQNFDKSYLGALRSRGVTPTELPFPGFITEKITGKIAQENEIASWGGKRLATVPDGSLINDVVDGYQEICKQEIADGNLTPVVTGAITNTNAVEKARLVYKALAPQYQKTALTAFVSPDHLLKLQEDYQERYGKYTTSDGTTFRFGIGLGNGGVTFRACAGITGDFMMMTPESNLHYGYADEGPLLRFQTHYRQLAIMSDFWIGYQIGIISDQLLRTNDQGIA